MELLDASVFQKFKRLKAIKYYNSTNSSIEVTYEQLWNDMQTVVNVLKQQNIEQKVVGVRLFHSPALIAVIGGIILSDNCFYCIDYQSLEPLRSGYGECAAFFLEDRGAYQQLDGLRMHLGLRLYDTPLMVALSSPPAESGKGLAYCVRTSGSTGQPKTVLVPKSCILPNILSLGEQFELTESDVVFVCSPPTFDPFVVDILLGLRAGATLLLVDNLIRLSSASRLLPLLFPGITFLQTTPSMFARWHNQDTMDVILGPSSTLRVLVLGGEKFPTLLMPTDCRTTVYNIYGITEVSCWSTIHEVDPLDKVDEVPLGKPLDSSIVLQLRDPANDQVLVGSATGHLYIGSATRKCVIVGNNEPSTDVLSVDQILFRATGDLVELTLEGRYFYRGRCNRTIKRFGHRVNLQELEAALQTHLDVLQSAACVIGDEERLVMFFTSCSKDQEVLYETLWMKMRSKVNPEQLPDELHRIEGFPLSAHGKICNHGLATLYRDFKHQQSINCTIPVDYFRAELKAMGILCENHSAEERFCKRVKGHSSFIDRGGTSIGAIRLHASLEDRFKVRLPELLTLLVDATVPLEQVYEYLANGNCDNSVCDIDAPADVKLTIEGRYDLGKCIDSRPSVTFCSGVGHILSIGSHSGTVLTIHIDSDRVLSRVLLPDRIECSVSFLTLQGNTIYAIVGCYDGFLYCFNPLNGTIAWKYDAGGMIKGSVLILPESNVIIFGCYGTVHNLHCLLGTCNEPVLRWAVKIGSKPILSRPTALGGEGGDGSVLVATLDGTLASICVASGRPEWSRKLRDTVPIFSSPTFLAKYEKIALCGVDGNFCTFDSRSGKETATYKFPGNVFSSLEPINRSQDRIHFVVGCYDHHIHCIEYQPLRDLITPKWKLETQSQIYATPLLIGEHLLTCTTSGYINLVDIGAKLDGAERCKTVATLKVGGELFAQPVAHGNVAFVGCRDNFLYKILVNV